MRPMWRSPPVSVPPGSRGSPWRPTRSGRSASRCRQQAGGNPGTPPPGTRWSAIADMERAMRAEAKVDRLYDIIKDFDNAVLVTRNAEGKVHARPMAVAEIRPDGDIFFTTDINSPKVAEIARDPDVVVSFQS